MVASKYTRNYTGSGQSPTSMDGSGWVRGRYLWVSGPAVLVSGTVLHPRFLSSDTRTVAGFGADPIFSPWITNGAPKLFSPLVAHLIT
jgi:hypothetical protein